MCEINQSYLHTLKPFQHLDHQCHTIIRQLVMRGIQWNSIVICLLLVILRLYGPGFVMTSKWWLELQIQLLILTWLSRFFGNTIRNLATVERHRHLLHWPITRFQITDIHSMFIVSVNHFWLNMVHKIKYDIINNAKIFLMLYQI